MPSFVAEFSISPDDIAACASRMPFISCCMNIVSNCFAVSLIAAFGSREAELRNAARARVSIAAEAVPAPVALA